MWRPDNYLEKLLDRLHASRQQPPEHWEQRSRSLKASLSGLLGDFAEMAETPLHSRALEKADTAHFICERIEYSTGADLRVPAYLLRPKAAVNQRKPAILALHGHGYGSREMVGLLPDGSERTGPPGSHGTVAAELVSRGFIVLVPEVIGFGDRKLSRDADQPDPIANSCFPLASALLLAGKTLAGLRVCEARRAIDYLTSRMDVNRDRIGCIGFSGGGMIASLTSALDERLGATVLCGYTNTYRGSILARRHCLDNYIPGILQYAEMPELIGLIAPRPLFIESGTEDPLFPEQHVREAIRTLSGIYRSLGAEDNLDFDLFEGGHEISGRRSCDWLASVFSQK